MLAVLSQALSTWLMCGAPPYYYRDELDPMALGTCRYSGERLPLFPHKGEFLAEQEPA